MAGVPALALMRASGPPQSAPALATSGKLTVAAVGPPHQLEVTAVQPDTSPPANPPTTADAPTTSTTIVTRVRTAVRPTTSTTAPRRTTTTTKPAPKPAAAPAKTPSSSAPRSSAAPAPSGRSQSGGATWYDAAPSGTCAHQTLPMGTVVTIHASNGATAQCTVSDRGPYAQGMIIDLAKDVFSRLAPLSQGVVQVTISW